jgi:hypothetical protein
MTDLDEILAIADGMIADGWNTGDVGMLRTLVAEHKALQEDLNWQASLTAALVPYQDRAIAAEARIAQLEARNAELSRDRCTCEAPPGLPHLDTCRSKYLAGNVWRQRDC